MSMSENIKPLKIHRYENNMLVDFEDDLGVETELEIIYDDKIFNLKCTNIHLEELRVGFLFSSNVKIENRKDATGKVEISYEKILCAFKDFSLAAPIFKKTGSTHSGQLLDKDYNILFFTEDMGRHNVIDKIIGFIVINKIQVEECTLMISSRMPLELITKAYECGIMKIASISAPTIDAVSFARENSISLVGMYRNNRFNVYSK